MAASQVVYWDCVMNHDWSGLSSNRKIGKLFAALRVAAARIGDAQAPWFFVGPEYAFGQEHIAMQEFLKIRLACERASAAHDNLVLIPGSAAVKMNTSGYNICGAYFGGREVSNFSKKHGVGEVKDGSDLSFVPGSGKGVFTAGDLDCGVQICRDAFIEGVLARQVDIHVIVAQGMDNAHAINKATRYQIIGDAGGRGVWSYADGKTKIDHAEKNAAEGVDLYYYDIDV